MFKRIWKFCDIETKTDFKLQKYNFIKPLDLITVFHLLEIE